jgi:hypothetical protein
MDEEAHRKTTTGRTTIGTTSLERRPSCTAGISATSPS